MTETKRDLIRRALDENVVYGMNFQVVCEPREFISYDIQYNSDITFCLREFKVNSSSIIRFDRFVLQILLGLADLLNLPMTLLFDTRGRFFDLIAYRH